MLQRQTDKFQAACKMSKLIERLKNVDIRNNKTSYNTTKIKQELQI